MHFFSRVGQLLARSLELRLCRRDLLEQWLKLAGSHHVTLDLQLPLHEKLLRVRLSDRQLREIIVVEDERDCEQAPEGGQPK